ncbi:MAG TPA: hypothetical protein VGK59_09995 [Ohtaekwangia sp.]
MLIAQSVRSTLMQLHEVLSALSQEEYKRPLAILNNASIGQHTRHVIEFFQALNSSYEAAIINYDKRTRNMLLETDRESATRELSAIAGNPLSEDKDVWLTGSYSSDTTEQATVKSSYYREIVYNLEHTIHHMALIRIAISQSTNVILPFGFGVAPATILHKKSVL